MKLKKEIRHIRTLVYFDGPQVYEGIDQVGTKYICVAISQCDDGIKYLCTSVSYLRLNKFYMDEIDLRSIFTESETEEYFIIDIDDENYISKKIDTISFDQLTENMLPDSGFLLNLDCDFRDEIVKESYNKNRAIVHLSLYSSKDEEQPKIFTGLLIGALQNFQSLIMHAYKKANSELDKAERQLLNLPSKYSFDVYGFANSSFSVHLQSQDTGDFFGYVDVDKALSKIDEIVNNIDDPEKTLLIIRKNKGHLANVYIKLLKYVVENDISLKYTWKIPSIESLPKSNHIPFRKALPVYELLNKWEELKKEEIILEGKLIEANTDTREWIIETNDGEWLNGIVEKNSKISFIGKRLGKKYKLICEETIEEQYVSGKEKRLLVLKNIEEVEEKYLAPTPSLL